MRHVHLALLSSLTAASVLACGDDPAPPGTTTTTNATPAVVADLRADSNRDGAVRFDDSDALKTTWDEKSGAIFLANIDDDLVACPDGLRESDLDLAACNDAADDVVNGPDDLADLAPLATRPWTEAPEGTTATISVADGKGDFVRLFKATGAGVAPEDFVVLGSESLSLEEIRAGVSLRIEAKDIVRDLEVWDGYVTVELSVVSPKGTATDAVKLRVAPVLTPHHLLPAEEVFVSRFAYPGNAEMRADLSTACRAAGVPEPTPIDVDDPWTQDIFETAFMSMPDDAGGQHVIRVNYRSPNVWYPRQPSDPLREAGRYVFTHLRGKDSAGVQQFDIRHSQAMDSLNSFGNTETVPPYTLGEESYPFGRLLRGKTDRFYPDPTFTKMLESQAMQPPIYVDTSWLFVSHVDETLSFVKTSSPRGWAMLVNDAAMAKRMLEDLSAKGHGAARMFVGKSWYDEDFKASPAEATIDQILADPDVMAASAEAVVEVDAQVATLKVETGITDAELVPVPFLHHAIGGGSIAYQPGTVNGAYIADDTFVAPKTHGPMIDGKDPFEVQLIEALAKVGVKARFAEDWDGYHAALGEVHCGSNTRRKIPEAKWWESGR